MNKDRRKAITEATGTLETARDNLQDLLDALRNEDTPSKELVDETLTAIRALNIEDATAAIETARDEEQDYYDNMPESFQSGEKGGNAQEAIDNLGYAHDELDGLEFSPWPEDAENKTAEELDTHIEETIGKLDTAIDYANAACG